MSGIGPGDLSMDRKSRGKANNGTTASQAGGLPPTVNQAGSTPRDRSPSRGDTFDTFIEAESLRKIGRQYEGELTPEEEAEFIRRAKARDDNVESTEDSTKHTARRNLAGDLDDADTAPAPPISATMGRESGSKLLLRRNAVSGKKDSSSKKQALTFLNQLIRLERTDPEVMTKFIITVQSPDQLLEEAEKKLTYFKSLNVRLLKSVAVDTGQALVNSLEIYSEQVIPLLGISAQCFTVMLGFLLTRPSSNDSGNRAAVAGQTKQYFEQLGRMSRYEIAYFWTLPGQTGLNPELITGKPYELRNDFGFNLFIDDHADEHAADAFWGLVSYLTSEPEIAAYQIPVLKAKWTLFNDDDRDNCPELPRQTEHPLLQKDEECITHWCVRESEAYVPYAEILETLDEQPVSSKKRIANARSALKPSLIAFSDRKLCDNGIDWESMKFNAYSNELQRCERNMKLAAKAAHQRRSAQVQTSQKPLPRTQTSKPQVKIAAHPIEGKVFNRDSSQAKPAAPPQISILKPPARVPGAFIPEAERKCRNCGGQHFSSECTSTDRPTCKQFASTGKCDYGRRCKFLHPDSTCHIEGDTQEQQNLDNEQDSSLEDYSPSEDLLMEEEELCAPESDILDNTCHIEDNTSEADPDEVYFWEADNEDCTYFVHTPVDQHHDMTCVDFDEDDDDEIFMVDGSTDFNDEDLDRLDELEFEESYLHEAEAWIPSTTPVVLPIIPVVSPLIATELFPMPQSGRIMLCSEDITYLLHVPVPLLHVNDRPPIQGNITKTAPHIHQPMDVAKVISVDQPPESDTQSNGSEIDSSFITQITSFAAEIFERPLQTYPERKFTRLIIEDSQHNILVQSSTPTLTDSTRITLPGGMLINGNISTPSTDTNESAAYCDEVITINNWRSTADRIQQILVKPESYNMAEHTILFHLQLDDSEIFKLADIEDDTLMWMSRNQLEICKDSKMLTYHVRSMLWNFDEWQVVQRQKLKYERDVRAERSARTQSDEADSQDFR